MVSYNKEKGTFFARYASSTIFPRSLPKSARRGVRSTIAVTYR